MASGDCQSTAGIWLASSGWHHRYACECCHLYRYAPVPREILEAIRDEYDSEGETWDAVHSCRYAYRFDSGGMPSQTLPTGDLRPTGQRTLLGRAGQLTRSADKISVDGLPSVGQWKSRCLSFVKIRSRWEIEVGDRGA